MKPSRTLHPGIYSRTFPCARLRARSLTEKQRYLLINYYLAELLLRDNQSQRKTVLERAQETYEKYLSLLDTYEILSASDKKLYERYLNDRKAFSTASTTDIAARRDTKIRRFRQEKELKEKLDVRNLHCHQLVDHASNNTHSTSPTTQPPCKKTTPLSDTSISPTSTSARI